VRCPVESRVTTCKPCAFFAQGNFSRGGLCNFHHDFVLRQPAAQRAAKYRHGKAHVRESHNRPG